MKEILLTEKEMVSLVLLYIHDTTSQNVQRHFGSLCLKSLEAALQRCSYKTVF